jgi:PKD repeat protein
LSFLTLFFLYFEINISYMNKLIFTLIIIVGCLLSINYKVFTNSAQPDLGRTNAPGESNCSTGCHVGGGNPNNNSDNNVTFNFNNNNPNYQPSTSYNVTITVTNPAQSRFGFEATALTFPPGNAAAGTFTVLNATNTGTASSGGRNYVFHKNANSNNSWTFQWNAPATNVGDIVFYVAANAANNNGLNTGDIIYVDTFIIRAPVLTPPTANFTANNTTICQGQSVTFTDNSSNDVTAWNWNFGTGASPATANTKGPHAVTYSSSGTKTVSLTVTSPGGTATETKNNFINVNGLPNASAGNDVAICRGNSTTLNASGGTTYLWSPSAGLSATNIFNPNASPTITTTYTVTVTDANSCSATAQVTITVNDLPVASFTMDDNAGCVPHTVQFTNTTPNSSDCVWNFNDGSNSIACTPTKVFNIPSTYTVSLTVTDNNNCTASTQQTVTVFLLPNASAGNDVTICSGGAVQLTGSGGTDYEWNTGATTQSITEIPSVNTTYTVTVTDANGCSTTDDVTVTVSNFLVISVSNDTTICEGNPVQLIAGGGNTFSWSPAAGLSNPDIANPVASPADTTEYKVIVADGVCIDSAYVTVNVTPAIAADISPDTTVIVSGSIPAITLSASGGSSYSWSPVDGLDNPNNATPVLDLSTVVGSFDTTLTYTVTITDGACSETLSVNITVEFVVGIADAAAIIFSVYPNPTSGIISVHSNEKIVSVSFIDLNGKKYHAEFYLIENTLFNIDAAALLKGIYLMSIETNDGKIYSKRVVLN